MPKKATKTTRKPAEPKRPEDKDIRLTPLYTMEIDGKQVKYYTYTADMSMPKERAFMASVFSRFANMNVSKETLTKMLTASNELINKGKFADVATINNEILSRMDLYCEEETLKNLAAVYSVREGENPDVFSDEAHELKKREIGSSLAAKGFFLEFAFRFTENYSKNLELSILEYLVETAAPLTKSRTTTHSTT